MSGYGITSPTTLPDLSEIANTTMEWFRGDNIDRYHRNINNGENVPYGEHDITYTFNSHGFRSPEFDAEIPNMAFYGCSIMQGYGLPNQYAIPALVSNGFDIGNVHNLGIAGASNDLITRTILSTIPLLNPEIVFIYWTYLTRREIFSDSGEPIRWSRSWKRQTVTAKDENIPYMVAQDQLTHFSSNINNILKNIILVDYALKARNIKYYWSMVDSSSMNFDSVYKEFAPYLNNFVSINLVDIQVDYSRDLMHPGLNTAKIIADRIKNRIEI